MEIRKDFQRGVNIKVMPAAAAVGGEFCLEHRHSHSSPFLETEYVGLVWEVLVREFLIMELSPRANCVSLNKLHLLIFQEF